MYFKCLERASYLSFHPVSVRRQWTVLVLVRMVPLAAAFTLHDWYPF